LTDDEVLMG